MTADAKSNEFNDTVVAVVGGNVGVGPAVVEAFLARLAKVVVGRVSAPEPCAPATGVMDLPVDLADPTTADRFLEECESRAGSVHVLVIVAPPVRTQEALKVSRGRMQEVVQEELLGPAYLMQECARRMVQRNAKGRLISFVSMSGKTGVHKHVAPYAAAKGGLIAYSRVLAAELAPSGVTVNVVAMSLFDAQLTGKSAEARAAIEAGIPVGRAGRASEAAHAALFLASADAAYITGETLNLSGGRFMD